MAVGLRVGIVTELSVSEVAAMACPELAAAELSADDLGEPGRTAN